MNRVQPRAAGISRRAILGGLGAVAFSRPAAAAETYPSSVGPLGLSAVASGLEHPWGFAFLPDRSIIVTERPGRMRLIREGALSAPLTGLPEIEAGGQGGLLDVALDPDFAANRMVIFTFTEPRAGGNGTAVAKGRLSADGSALEETEVFFRQMPTYRGRNHFGSRLAFDRDGLLFVTLGDRYGGRNLAQDINTHFGKVVRITTRGGSPAANPFFDADPIRRSIWSYGHRNPQAAAIHPATNQLWTVEHGAQGGDEVNAPKAGKNYGWPIITYGKDYSGAKIGEGTAKAGMEQPIHYWDPSIAPSGMAFYTGDLFPAWKGNLFVGALAGMMLVRLTLDGENVTGEERLLESLGERIRDVRQGPDGALYIATDNSDGRILRITPATS
jgi:aldose sugar dehydrogenase